MKVIILAAGQGKRLLPLTAEEPKSMLDLGGQMVAAWQVQELVKAGVDEIVFVVGFKAELAELRLVALRQRFPECSISVHHNPDYATSDNLFSCWSVRAEMDGDFFLLNGDTLFEADVFTRLAGSPHAPITVTVDHKAHYDEDDMKVQLDGTRLAAIGKTLPAQDVGAESIGMIYFRGQGPSQFAEALEVAHRDEAARKKWYLSVISEMAKTINVQVCSISGLDWCEIDYPLDLARARQMVGGWPPLPVAEENVTAVP